MCQKMNILNIRKSYSERIKQCYVPFDACFGLCSDSTILFLPPSKTCMGIISKTLPLEYPLEYNPSEYFGVYFEDGSFIYCRPHNGFKNYFHWTFDAHGRANLKIEREGIEILFLMEIIEDDLISIHTKVSNNTSKCIKSMYLNPCLRYSNQWDLKGTSHENVYLSTNEGMKAIPDIVLEKDVGERILFLNRSIYKEWENKRIAPLMESLMKARAMRFAENDNIDGETIICMSLENQEGLLFGYNSPFGFFSRSKREESGCIHVLPFVEYLEPLQSINIEGVILWGRGSVDELQLRYKERNKM